MRHIKGIDGLRAFAVLGVLLYHQHVPKSGLGWSGVQLFFVISGFLITRILLDTKEASNYFSSFYARRVLRIFPIYYLTLIFLVIVDAVHGRPLSDVPYYFLYLQNHILAATQFNPKAPWFLYHTWSLAVEEQFYLLWPLVVWITPRQRLIQICAALMVIAPATRLVMFLVSKNVYYPAFLLLPQADALAAGALLACLPVANRRALVRASAIAGAAGLAAFMATLGYDALAWPKTYLVAPSGVLLHTVLALLFLSVVGGVAGLSDGAILRALEFGPLRGIGRISYGVYMYHTLVFGYALTYSDRMLSRLKMMKLSDVHWSLRAPLLIALTIGVAAISWRVIESPINSLKRRFAARPDGPSHIGSSPLPAAAAAERGPVPG